MATAFYTLRQSVGRLLGLGDVAMRLSVPTGGLATTGCQASALDQFEDDYFNEDEIRFYLGTHKDTTRTVTDFAKSNGTLTWSPALTGASDATDYFELWRNFTVDEVNGAINAAIQLVEDEALADKIDETLVVDNLLTDPCMEAWTSSSVLTNYTTAGTGTLARESTIKWEGTYSAKLTNTVSNAFSIFQSIGNWPMYAGEADTKASLYAHVMCMTADRVRLQLEDGVNTWNSSYHDGTGWREGVSEPYLKIENVTPSSAATQLKASFRIETGSSIDAYVDKMWLKCGKRVVEYTMPSGFVSLYEVYQEGSTPNQFWNRIEQDRGWRVYRNGTTTKLWLSPNLPVTQGRKLRLVGQSLASQLTLDADTTPIAAGYIVHQAKALLLESRIGRMGVTPDMVKLAQAMADRERAKVFVNARGVAV